MVEGRVRDPELDALNRSRIDTGPQSPDGYVFERNTRRGGGLFAEIFGARRYRGAYYVLKNGGRRVPVVGQEPIYSAHFIGWIVP